MVQFPQDKVITRSSYIPPKHNTDDILADIKIHNKTPKAIFSNQDQ